MYLVYFTLKLPIFLPIYAFKEPSKSQKQTLTSEHVNVFLLEPLSTCFYVEWLSVIQKSLSLQLKKIRSAQ